MPILLAAVAITTETATPAAAADDAVAGPVLARVQAVIDGLLKIFEESAATGKLTNDIADQQARRIIDSGL